jgi:hypothetical protein
MRGVNVTFTPGTNKGHTREEAESNGAPSHQAGPQVGRTSEERLFRRRYRIGRGQRTTILALAVLLIASWAGASSASSSDGVRGLTLRNGTYGEPSLLRRASGVTGRTTTTLAPTTEASTTTTLAPTTTTLAPTTEASTTTTNIEQQLYTSPVKLVSGLTVENARFKLSPDDGDGSRALAGSNISNVTIRDIEVISAGRGLQAGASGTSSNLYVNGLSGTVAMGFSATHLVDSTIENVDFTLRNTTKYDHLAYVQEGVKRVTFKNLKSRGGLGYGLHLYQSAGIWSEYLLFDGVDVVTTNRSPIVISSYFRDVTIRNMVGTGPGNWPIVNFYGNPENVIIENFEFWGGSSLAGGYGKPKNVVFRNGIYHGSKLGSVPGVTFENVTLTP